MARVSIFNVAALHCPCCPLYVTLISVIGAGHLCCWRVPYTLRLFTQPRPCDCEQVYDASLELAPPFYICSSREYSLLCNLSLHTRSHYALCWCWHSLIAQLAGHSIASTYQFIQKDASLLDGEISQGGGRRSLPRVL